jgi:tetratricopeptide (TPR) repeat protein
MAVATKENDPTQALLDALRHPLRRALLHRYVTAEEPTSPKYLANSMRQPLSSVSYHVRELAKLGALEIAEEEQRRGAGEVDKGLAEFEALTEDEEYRQRPYLFMGIGVIHYNHTRDFSQARDAYQRAAELKPSPQAFLYLADAQRSLGEDGSARENYRKALMLDPTLVDAHRGYTGVAGGAGVAPPLFNRVVSAMAEARTSPLPLNRILRPLLWRLLLWHYKRHPEDSRLHYMLGYCALLREEFDFAIERLIYAFKLFEGADLEALAVAATAMGLKGDTDACRDALKTLRTSPIRPGMAALTGADDSIAQRLSTVFSPFNWEPRLLELQTTGSLEQALNGVFPDYAPRQ